MFSVTPNNNPNDDGIPETPVDFREDQTNQEPTNEGLLDDDTANDLLALTRYVDSALPRPTGDMNQTTGWVQKRWNSLFGQKLKEVKVHESNKVLQKLGELTSFLLLILFSVSTLLVVEQSILKKVPAIWQRVSLIELTTTALFVLAMDLCMFLAIIWLKDMLSSKRKWTTQRRVLSLSLVVYIIFLASIEGLTFYALLTHVEITGLLNVLRAIGIPVCVVFLMARPKRVLTREDIDNTILGKVAAALFRSLDNLSISGNVQFDSLLEIFVTLVLPDNESEAEKQRARDNILTSLLSKMRPDAWKIPAMNYIKVERAKLMDALNTMKETYESRLADAMSSITALQTEKTDLDVQYASGVKHLSLQQDSRIQELEEQLSTMERQQERSIAEILLSIAISGDVPDIYRTRYPNLPAFTVSRQARRVSQGTNTLPSTPTYASMYASHFQASSLPVSVRRGKKEGKVESANGRVYITVVQAMTIVSGLAQTFVEGVIAPYNLYVGNARVMRLDTFLKNKSIRPHLKADWKTFIDSAAPVESDTSIDDEEQPSSHVEVE